MAETGVFPLWATVSTDSFPSRPLPTSIPAWLLPLLSIPVHSVSQRQCALQFNWKTPSVSNSLRQTEEWIRLQKWNWKSSTSSIEKEKPSYCCTARTNRRSGCVRVTGVMKGECGSQLNHRKDCGWCSTIRISFSNWSINKTPQSLQDLYFFLSLLHDFFLESILALTSYDTAKSLHAATVKHPWGFLCSGIKK